MTKMSDRGVAFVERHEGTVLRAYKDPVGVVTIGNGFTNGSRVAVQELGRIRLGMTITREQSRRLLRRALDEEYGPPAERAAEAHGRPVQQHEYDASGSVCFNLGPGAAQWKWMQALARGDVSEAARLLAQTGTTAKGRRLPGLVRRRREEAALLERGDYGHGAFPTFEPAEQPVREVAPDPVLSEYQAKLKELGYYRGDVDGWRGPLTTAATRAFQGDHRQLAVDGVLGRATMAQIDRVLDLRRKAATQPAAGGAAGGAAGAGGEAAMDPSSVGVDALGWGVVVGVVVFLVVAGFLAYRYRDEIFIAIKSITNREE